MASYLRSTQDFLYRRRRPFLIVGGLVGGVYVAANYAITKLSDMQRRMVEERRDRENLRRRFAQNQEDCSFTILALLPTLGDQLFAYLDVEGLTVKLQRGRPSATEGTRSPASAAANGRSEDAGPNDAVAMNGSADIETGETHASLENVPPVSINSTTPQHGTEGEADRTMEEVWTRLDAKNGQAQTMEQSNSHAPAKADVQVEAGQRELNGELHSAQVNGDGKAADRVDPSSSSGLDAVSEPAPRPIPREARLTPSPQPSPRISVQESVPIYAANGSATTESKLTNGDMPHNDAHPIDSADSSTSLLPPAAVPVATTVSAEDALVERQQKVAWWNELKIAAISRTVTSLYGVVLLSLQTHVQLNLLGRYAYLTSVSSLSSSDDSTANHRIRIERHDGQGSFDDDGYDDDGTDNDASLLKDGVDMQTERLYLTLSWWFLHRGWRQLADVVQDAVHEVFDDVALKSTLTHADFFALLRHVRRRVEYESRSHTAGSSSSSSSISASMASLDARSDWSEATSTPATAAAREARRRRRRNFGGILFPPVQHEVQTLFDAGALPANSPAFTPAGASLEAVSSTLPALLDETRDIIESDDFWRIMRLGLGQVFDVLEDSLRPAFGLGPAPARETAPSAAAEEQGGGEKPPSAAPPAVPSASEQVGNAVRLASLFPTVARQSTVAVHGERNAYVDAMANVKELRAFCAVIYSAWS